MSPARSAANRMLPWAELAGFSSAATCLVYLELSSHPAMLSQPQSLIAYVPNPETTGVGLALLATPLLWWLGGRSVEGCNVKLIATTSSSGEVEAGSGGVGEKEPLIEASTPLPYSPTPLLPWCLSFILFVLSVCLTGTVGLAFRGMPPAYHDEYSYLFQAKTFLAGRLYFPQHPMAESFDQMHVLNDNGVFASRFFPGVGLWLAPWVALGQPYWGQYLAGGLIVVLVFWIGRELEVNRSNAVGFLAGLFCAISPAMLIFGNLLLSHHPTMLGLAAFVLCYLRALRSEGLGWPVAGGIALGFAMLCRPLTAFGYALPFGVCLFWLVARGRLNRWVPRSTAALAPPLLAIGLLGAYNAALTSNPFLTPYGLYTEIYTPNHAYGFHNVTRGEEHIGPKVRASYNRWAHELTLSRACELLARRVSASSHWSMGPVSLAWLAAVFLVALSRFPVKWRLIAGAAVGLHAVYFPYGFEGIFELSYVFESVPLLCLLTSGVCVWLWRTWRQQGRWGRRTWLVLFLVTGLFGPAYRLLKPGSDGGISQVLFSRQYYASFEQRLQNAGLQAPALVFIESNPADIHLDLVTNSPTLDDPMLRVRNLGYQRDMTLAQEFPDRQIWFFDARSNQLEGGHSFKELVELMRERRPTNPQQPATDEKKD